MPDSRGLVPAVHVLLFSPGLAPGPARGRRGTASRGCTARAPLPRERHRLAAQRRARLWRRLPVEARRADQASLDHVGAPAGEHGRGAFVGDPFGHRLDLEVAGEVDEGADEDLIVAVCGQVLDEGAVDLDEVDVEAAEIAEAGEAGAEIVDGDAAAEVVQEGDEARRFLDVADHGAL